MADKLQVRNRAFLKAATREAHQTAERFWVGRDGFETLAAYRRWLWMMLRLHQSQGIAAAHILRNVCDPDVEQSRVIALQSDLRTKAGSSAKRSKMSESWAWGVLYVLNGSALGATMLLKSSRDTAEWPTEYLARMSHYATSGGLNRFFDALDGEDINLNEARDGASLAFSLITQRGRH